MTNKELGSHPTNVVLIDLDGTMTKSDIGILECARHAYRTLGRPVPSQSELSTFVGPPLFDSFAAHGLTREEAMEAARIYRHAYTHPVVKDPRDPAGPAVEGMFLNEVYRGIPEALDELRRRGCFLAMCTAKPEVQAVAICEHYGLDAHLDALFGASLDMTRIHKSQVIHYAFDRIHFDAEAGDRAVMVGDRWTDVDGAHLAGLGAIGCRWGFPAPGELESHRAEMVIDAPGDLPDACERFFKNARNA